MTATKLHPHSAVEMAMAGKLGRSRRIFLKNFETRISMGIHDFEKKTRQRIMVNVDLFLEPEARIERDHISETVDYDFLRREIAVLAESGHFHLQETFCEKILATCLAKPGVVAVRVSSEKLDVYPDCESIGFEIFRAKQE
jgi:7,8-dihydroneopterin aldolase/epimerase/oxygenase